METFLTDFAKTDEFFDRFRNEIRWNGFSIKSSSAQNSWFLKNIFFYSYTWELIWKTLDFSWLQNQCLDPGAWFSWQEIATVHTTYCGAYMYSNTELYYCTTELENILLFFQLTDKNNIKPF